MTHLHPRSEITISLHVLSQDGGVLAACINATTLALIDAGIPMSDYVVGMSAGSSSSTSAATAGGVSFEEAADPLLDVNHIEEGELPHLTVATLGATEKITLLTMESKVHLAMMEGMLAVAVDGCRKLREMLDDVVRAHGSEIARNGAL
jgi:exosome complex component RRP41